MLVMGCIQKLGQIPFASLIAFLICLSGIGVFCGTLYKALHIVLVQVMGELFEFKVEWLEIIQVVFIVIAVAMGVFAIILLAFGFLATGATRKNVYSGEKCIMGGRISAAFFLLLSYLLNLVWLFITSVGVVPIIFYISLSSICSSEVYNRNANELKICFELRQFGIYHNHSRLHGLSPPGHVKLCNTDFRKMCDRIFEAGPLFCVAYAGAFIIVVAMIHFMIALTANYTRIKIAKELTEYRDAVEMEELELSSICDKSRSAPI